MSTTDETLNIQYLPMSLTQHDSKVVAELIYQSAPELFDVMFGKQAIHYLQALVARSHNRFSHRYIQVAIVDQQIVGIVTLFPSDSLNSQEDDHQEEDHRRVLNIVQRLWLKALQFLVLRHVLRQDFPPGSLYIGNIAVAEPYRGQGIGRQLLLGCIQTAQANSSPLFINVDVDNPRAQKLYESLGFQVEQTKTLRLFRTTIGSRSLSLSTTT